MLFTKKKHGVTSLERAHNITWSKQKGVKKGDTTIRSFMYFERVY